MTKKHKTADQSGINKFVWYASGSEIGGFWGVFKNTNSGAVVHSHCG
jgi:hypothetical protein